MRLRTPLGSLQRSPERGREREGRVRRGECEKGEEGQEGVKVEERKVGTDPPIG